MRSTGRTWCSMTCWATWCAAAFPCPCARATPTEVFILTSGENMALHAAANIAMALDNFKDRGYARLGGLILNRRDVPREEEKVAELAEDLHSTIIGSLPPQRDGPAGRGAGQDGAGGLPGQRHGGGVPGPGPAGPRAGRRGAGMLTRVNGPVDDTGAAVAIKDASFPAPFASGLEYAAPARGTWNIVHVGMLIPQAHQIFVCAQGCLRGVVLTAAEMGAQERFSTVAIEEHNVLEGDLEELLVDGVTDILRRLPKRPPAVLIYTSCIHHFLACDLPLVYQRLGERFPEVDFVDCYMNPIMRKSGLTPDQLMRRQLYAALKPRPREERTVGILRQLLPPGGVQRADADAPGAGDGPSGTSTTAGAMRSISVWPDAKPS